VITTMTARHRAVEFIKFLNLIDAQVPAHLDVHLILDSLASYCRRMSDSGH